MAEIIPHSGLTLLDAYRAAKSAGMHLIEIGGEVKISPIIPSGAREIPIRVKITSPSTDRAAYCRTYTSDSMTHGLAPVLVSAAVVGEGLRP